MARIVICGGSVIGLSAGLMLARDGHEVSVFEADPDAPPAEPERAWASWDRRGVPQFRQPHNLFARARHILDAELPGITDDLLAAGCVWVDFLGSAPPGLRGGRQPGDDYYRHVTGRRPVVESVLAAAAAAEPGLTINRGVRVAGLLAGPEVIPGVPHAAGIRAEPGREVTADLVVDATGRRSPAAGWLAQLGARPPLAESSDSGFVYYTRYFRGPRQPELVGPALAAMGTFSILTLDGDNRTWSVTMFGPTGDPALKALRDPDCFSRVAAACPLQAHWLDGTPLTKVLPMAGILDRYRRFVVGGDPVVTGFAAVGDAWACTNPSAGRGVSVGLVHAQQLRQVVRHHLGSPGEFAAAWDESTERAVAPFYRNQLAFDQARLAEMEALRCEADWRPPDTLLRRLAVAASHDPEVFRGFVETILCLALPEEVAARPGLQDKIDKLGAGEPQQLPGPDRAALLRLLAA